MAGRRPEECRRKVETATCCSGVYPTPDLNWKKKEKATTILFTSRPTNMYQPGSPSPTESWMFCLIPIFYWWHFSITSFFLLVLLYLRAVGNRPEIDAVLIPEFGRTKHRYFENIIDWPPAVWEVYFVHVPNRISSIISKLQISNRIEVCSSESNLTWTHCRWKIMLGSAIGYHCSTA